MALMSYFVYRFRSLSIDIRKEVQVPSAVYSKLLMLSTSGDGKEMPSKVLEIQVVLLRTGKIVYIIHIYRYYIMASKLVSKVDNRFS